MNRKTTKIDLHIHTRGSDGWGSPEEIVGQALKAGLNGIAICDHHVSHTVEGLAVLREARKAGLLAIVGCEYSCEEGHLLVFGYRVQEFEFGTYPKIQDVIDRVTREGGVAIPAHPYRGFRRVLGDRVLDLTHIRAVEGSNGHAALWNAEQNAKARKAATKRQWQTTGGSDAHNASEVGTCFTVFEGIIRNEAQFLRALKRGHFHGAVNAAAVTQRLRLFATTAKQPRFSFSAPESKLAPALDSALDEFYIPEPEFWH